MARRCPALQDLYCKDRYRRRARRGPLRLGNPGREATARPAEDIEECVGAQNTVWNFNVSPTTLQGRAWLEDCVGAADCFPSAQLEEECKPDLLASCSARAMRISTSVGGATIGLGCLGRLRGIRITSRGLPVCSCPAEVWTVT